ncbi:MAG: hypothetical protein RLZZ28_661 [Bacteroidota bacterium]
MSRQKTGLNGFLVASVLLAAICLLPGMVFGQKKIILTDSNPSMLIGKSIYFFEDQKKQIEIGDLLSGKVNNRFKLYDKDAPNFGNVELRTWNKFTVINHSTSQWSLLVDSYSLDTLYFYYPDSSGNYQNIKSGRSLPLSARKYKSSVYVFDLLVPPGDSATFYLRVESFFMQYPLILMTKEKFVEVYHKKDRVEGFYYGFLLLLVLYNLFLYFSAGDKSYLYYIAYVIFNGLLIAQLKGFVAELWGDRLHFMWQYSPFVIGITGSVTFLFGQNILGTKVHAPWMHKLINFVFLPLYGLICILSLAGHNLLASNLNQIVGMAGLLLLYFSAIIVYRKGFRFARFFLLACFFYFFGVTIYVLKAFTILPHNTFTNNAIEIGSTFQMIMFAFTLADKVRAYKREKSAAQKETIALLKENERIIREQNKLLEIKVDERTKELQETLDDLEVSQIQLQETNQLITKEKEISENLLLNILPYETAQELKMKGKADAKFYQDVTVMFTDFKDFTGITEFMEPDKLVAELDYCFRAFDAIMEKYDIEKIKTIGDSYMAASGLPVPDESSARRMVSAAIEIKNFMEEYKEEKIRQQIRPFEIRIGVHTGPIVAGIVGSKKFAYDIWGDTVNTASRMESSGEQGKINISGATYVLIKNHFQCTYRGKITAKSKGEVDMYFVEAERS